MTILPDHPEKSSKQREWSFVDASIILANSQSAIQSKDLPRSQSFSAKPQASISFGIILLTSVMLLADSACRRLTAG